MVNDNKIGETQIYSLITGEELSWQSIIYDLIKTEQLDPWDIDLVVLSERYMSTIRELEDENFYVSSKVLLACSLLLRLKTDLLADTYIQELNDILFGRKDVQRTLNFEEYIINEGELPLLLPKSPMSRHKKVTLDELMQALNHAMNTETRRIKRTIKTHHAKKVASLVLPRNTFIPLKVRIKNIATIIATHLATNKRPHLLYTELASDREEKLASFLPILHLSHDRHVHLHQPVHFDEIFITRDIHPDEHTALARELSPYESET